MYKIALMSDWHIDGRKDVEYQNLLKHLRYILSNDYHGVAFLGDIFDLLIGNKDEYYQEYQEFFDLCGQLGKKSQFILYCEGNHDFALGDLFAKYVSSDNFLYVRNSHTIQIEGKRYTFTHGDVEQISTKSYILYKNMVRSNLFKQIINLMSHRMIQKIGCFLSRKSKRASRNNIVDKDQIRAKILSILKPNEILIMGHTHVEDLCENSNYLNVGFGRGNHLILDSFGIITKKTTEQL